MYMYVAAIKKRVHVESDRARTRVKRIKCASAQFFSEVCTFAAHFFSPMFCMAALQAGCSIRQSAVDGK